MKQEVEEFRRLGVKGCLVGETLMKASDPRSVIRSLFYSSSSSSSLSSLQSSLVVKTCGMQEVDDVKVALQSGANLIGVIFAAASPRKASEDQARQIVAAVRQYGERSGPVTSLADISLSSGESTREWFSRNLALLQTITTRHPLVVGVFQDQSSDEVNKPNINLNH